MSAEPLAHTYRYDAERTEEEKAEPLASAHGESPEMSEEEWAAMYSRFVPTYEAVQPPPGVDPRSDWYLQLTDKDLPCEDGMPVESWLHARQLQLLADVLRPEVQAGGTGFVGDEMFVYYTREQVEGTYVRGPDLFVSLGVDPRPERRSYVIWQEGKPPEVVIELLSLSTAKQDKTVKKAIYQDDIKVAEYYWYDPHRPEEFAGFALKRGVYQPMKRDKKGRYVSRVLGLALTRWEGEYAGEERTWLRWARLSGEILPTPQEARAEAEQKRLQAEEKAQAEARRRAAEKKRADKEAKRADAEAKARAELERQVAEMREKLAAIAAPKPRQRGPGK